MPEFEWKLLPPEEPVEAQPWEEFVSDSEDWQEDYASQVLLACDYLELCGYTFAVHGFGRDSWPVTVGYDLSTVLEDMPDQFAAIESEQPATFDLYAPGTEVEIDVVPVDAGVELRCRTAMWDPAPRVIRLSQEDVLGLVRGLLTDFSTALRSVGSSLSDTEPFLSWGQASR